MEHNENYLSDIHCMLASKFFALLKSEVYVLIFIIYFHSPQLEIHIITPIFLKK